MNDSLIKFPSCSFFTYNILYTIYTFTSGIGINYVYFEFG